MDTNLHRTISHIAIPDACPWKKFIQPQRDHETVGSPPRRFTDPFNHSFTVDYDDHSLVPIRTRDALGNVIQSAVDYRVLQPKIVTHPNGNRSEAAYDALGLLVGTAAMGKTTENLGDSMTAFRFDLTQAEIDGIFAHPKGPTAAVLLGSATVRNIYDVNRYWLGHESEKKPQPSFTAVLARERHASKNILWYPPYSQQLNHFDK
jgi:YD repeat-containing protein